MPFADVPATGIYVDRWHRYWWNGQGPLPSVTTITGVIDKPFLLKWAADMAASLAVKNADTLLGHLMGHIEEPTPDCEACLSGLGIEPWDAEGAAQRWLASAHTKMRDASADFGTRIHAHAEALTYGVEAIISDAERPAVEAFMRFRDDYKPLEIEAEYAVISERHRYGGTGDLLASINGYVTAVDYKSGKSIPTDIDLQLAGYKNADGIAHPKRVDLDPMPRIERCAVLHIRPDLYEKGYSFEYVPVTSATFEEFLAARRLYDWKKRRDAEWKRRHEEAKAA